MGNNGMLSLEQKMNESTNQSDQLQIIELLKVPDSDQLETQIYNEDEHDKVTLRRKKDQISNSLNNVIVDEIEINQTNQVSSH